MLADCRSPTERKDLAHRVTFIPGDGTGPEISEATQRVLEATGVEFEWDFQDAGVDVYEEEGNPLPDRTLDSIRERGIAIKGPTTTPVGSGFRPTRACAPGIPRRTS
jgi:isocitrate dehydrogenase (NAD+)